MDVCRRPLAFGSCNGRHNPLSNRREFCPRLTGNNCELALLCCGASEWPSPLLQRAHEA
jgi:hypothetical protein